LRATGLPPADGKRKGGIKVHTLIKSDQDVPCMVRFSASAAADSSFLKKVDLAKGSIVVFDKGYNDYNTYNGFTERGITWVTRLRQSAAFELLEDRPMSELHQQQGIVSDQVIMLGATAQKDKRRTQVRARLITYIDLHSGNCLEFLTNNMKMTAATIAGLYRERWQIEVLFKRLKQNYPLKYFLGDSENAIKIQIWCSLIADLLLKIVQKGCGAKWSFSNLISMIRLHLITYIDLFAFLHCPEKALLATIEQKQTNYNGLLFFT
jgi:transposase